MRVTAEDRHPYKMIVFDMDGTLIPGTTAEQFFATLKGRHDEAFRIELEFKQGTIDSVEFCSRIVELLHPLDLSLIRRHFSEIPKVGGIRSTLEALHARGLTSVILTSSGRHFAEVFKETYGFTHALGSEHEIGSDGCIGHARSVCDAAGKVALVRALTRHLGIDLADCIAVGDSRSDVLLFEAVGLSIAFNWDHHLDGRAKHYVRADSLSAILRHL